MRVSTVARRTVVFGSVIRRSPAITLRAAATGRFRFRSPASGLRSGGARVSRTTGSASRTVSTISNSPSEVVVAASRIPGWRPPGPGGRFRSGERPGAWVAVRVGVGVAVGVGSGDADWVGLCGCAGSALVTGPDPEVTRRRGEAR